MSATALPSAYAPFQPVFEALSDALRAAIAGQLAQMEPLARFIDEPTQSPWGELEGLGGLTRRGELTAILQSELLLRTEAPLEFLRRVAEGETLYHEQQYSDDDGRRVLRLMLSIGPGMLGHGRVFAIAALFIFARAAAQRGEALHWCFLPNNKGALWFDGLSLNSIKRFLKVASHRDMSHDDADDANAVWADVHGKDAPKDRTLDWVIGAHTGERGRTDAVMTAPRAIALRLDPPRRDAPRTADIFARRGGRSHRPMPFTFPADAVCLSALNKPFAMRAPNIVANAATLPALAKMESWAPRYITAPISDAKLIRMADGVLIVMNAHAKGFVRQYFIPIADGQILAGIQLRSYGISLLLHELVEGVETLSYSGFVLNYGEGTVRRSYHFEKAMPSAQLFRGHPRFALPTMVGQTKIALFNAANGKAFSLTEGGDPDIHFKAEKSGALLFSEGRHRIAQIEDRGWHRADIYDSRNSRVVSYVLQPDGIDAGRLHGMLYSHGEGYLAYSLQPHVWQLPPTTYAQDDRDGAIQCQLAPYEIPLLFRRDGDDIHATVWSDAALGGEGCVRTLHIRHGTIIGKGKRATLGAEAANLCQAILADDGIWAVCGDAQGVPETLVQYPKGQNRKNFPPRVHALAELRDSAVVIEMRR